MLYLTPCFRHPIASFFGFYWLKFIIQNLSVKSMSTNESCLHRTLTKFTSTPTRNSVQFHLLPKPDFKRTKVTAISGSATFPPASPPPKVMTCAPFLPSGKITKLIQNQKLGPKASMPANPFSNPTQTKPIQGRFTSATEGPDPLGRHQ